MVKNAIQYGQLAASAIIGFAFLGMLATIMLFDNKGDTD